MSRKVVAVFGATGGQGASVARELARHPDFTVRGLTRDINTTHAQRLKQDGADLICYDPYDRQSIESALSGAYACFVNTITDYNDPKCMENEKLQGQLIAEACKSVGVQHVVFSSQLHTTRVMGVLVRHMVAKAEIEDYMRDLALPVTCLIMPIYYEDFCGIFKPVTCDGYMYELLLPMGFTPLDMMSVEDLGPVVLHVLQNRAKYMNKTLSVSGDKLTMREVAAVLSSYLGPRKVFKDKQLTFQEFSRLDIPGVLDWAQMFNFFVRVDQRYNVMETRRLNPDMQNFETWCSRRD
nr:hypothetical protein BaRGS_011438 [Batillaria attramentaria]